MDFIKKFALIKNALGFIVIGAFFAGIGGMIFFSGNSDGSLMPLAFMLIGLLVMIVGILNMVKMLKTPAKELKQYDRVELTKTVPTEAELAQRKEEAMEDFVFHYTGKGNQSYIMKDADGQAVYEAICKGITVVKDTEFTFCDRITGEESKKMISHAITHAIDPGVFTGPINISSSINVDGVSVWDVIAAAGYGFRFGMHGIAVHYDVKRWGQDAGFAELGGTGLMNPKYKDNPLGKMPTNGIYKVRCRRSDIPGLFMICFATTKTELVLD